MQIVAANARTKKGLAYTRTVTCIHVPKRRLHGVAVQVDISNLLMPAASVHALLVPLLVRSPLLPQAGVFDDPVARLAVTLLHGGY